jgi:photosystem I subunit 9
MERRANNQPGFFLQYLSLIPVIAVVSISLAVSAWIFINAYFPDLLSHPMP